MSDKYKIRDDSPYFVTFTVTHWVDVFTRPLYKMMVVEALKYCQQHKGLEIYAWVLMPNHMHMIARATGSQMLWEIIRDFKKFTAKQVTGAIEDNPESRREWMLARFYYAGKYLKRIDKYKFWQDGSHAEIIYSPKFFYQKVNYIHKNPVKQMIVRHPEDYLFSSARNYAGLDGLLDVVVDSYWFSSSS
jgi:REP element-mobilizing transposase RayT